MGRNLGHGWLFAKMMIKVGDSALDALVVVHGDSTRCSAYR